MSVSLSRHTPYQHVSSIAVSSSRSESPSTFQGCGTPLPQPVKVVGVGSAGVDYLASVAAYPKPDEKLRTEKLEVQGGGNCANALTAAARLGLSPYILSKIGGDGLGDGIISELREDGVATQFMMRAAGHPSPFTYIIVDRQGGTRTCLHTPGSPLEPGELSPQQVDDLLAGAELCYFDGRLTEAALLVARRARQLGVPVLVEAERLRPSLELLLAEADYVVTSAHFPQDWTGEAQLCDALVALAQRLPRARFIITTRGTKGAVMLRRPAAAAAQAAQAADAAAAAAEPPAVSLEELMRQLEQQLEAATAAAAHEPREAACMSRSGSIISRPAVAQSPGPCTLGFSAARDATSAAAFAQEAAARAAALNAAGDRVEAAAGYAMTQVADRPSSTGVVAEVLMCSAAHLGKEAVVDTTGAGDAFIGSVLYGISTGMAPGALLQLAAVVAACKCTALGARPALPHRTSLRADLL